MRTIAIATVCASVLFTAGCSTLNRDHETALNEEVGIKVQPVDDGVEVRLPEVALFDFNQSTLRPDAKAVIKRSAVLVKRSAKPILVTGFTDNVGTRDYNMKLSEDRAAAVGYALVGQGVPIDRISTKGLAFEHPVASNDTEEGRQQNRRTEVVVRGETMDTLMGPDKKHTIEAKAE